MSKITDYSFLKMWLVSMKTETIWEGKKLRQTADVKSCLFCLCIIYLTNKSYGRNIYWES